MRNFIVRAAVLATLLGGASLAIAYSFGPPASRTGAFAVQNKAAESNCRVCHMGSALNDPSGRLQILDVPAQYVPGQTYPLRVHLEHTWNPLPATPLRWGFELQAVQASTGDSVGIWVLTPNTPPDTFKVVAGLSTTVWKNRRYLEHTRDDSNPKDPDGSTHYGELGPIEWHVNWQAPPGDSGKIFFFAAGNSANGNGFNTGDFIFTTAESTMGTSNVDVPPHPAPLQLRTALEPPFPNPMSKCTDISFTITRGGPVDVSIFDTKGRRVRTALHEFREAGSHASFWDGRGDDRMFVKNGVYFIRLIGPDGRRAAQKVVLAR